MRIFDTKFTRLFWFVNPLWMAERCAFHIIPLLIAAGAAAYGTYKASQAKKGITAQTIDPAQAQASALWSNLSNAGDAEKLANRTNAFNQAQNSALLEKAMPGWGQYTSNMMAMGNRMAAENPYELPGDVQDNLARLAAERGISAGTRGQFSDFSLLRDFGISSLDYANKKVGQLQGMTASLGALASMSRVNPMSVQSFYITPQDALGAQQYNANAQTQADLQRAQIDMGIGSMWANLGMMGAGMMYGAGTGATRANGGLLGNALGAAKTGV